MTPEESQHWKAIDEWFDRVPHPSGPWCVGCCLLRADLDLTPEDRLEGHSSCPLGCGSTEVEWADPGRVRPTMPLSERTADEVGQAEIHSRKMNKASLRFVGPQAEW